MGIPNERCRKVVKSSEMVVNSANFLGFGDFRRYLLGGGELRIVSKGEMIIKTYRS